MKRHLFKISASLLTVTLTLTGSTTPSLQSRNAAHPEVSSTLRPPQEGSQRAGIEERLTQSGAEEQIKVYLDAEIKNGRLTGSPKPIHEGIRVAPTLWRNPEVLQAQWIFLEGIRVHRMGEAGEGRGFSLKGRQYPVDPSLNLVTRLLVQADPRSGQVQAAYELETGKKIYPRKGIRVYLDEAKTPWVEGVILPKGLWTRPEILSSKQVVIEGVGTFAQNQSRSGAIAAFSIVRGSHYSTTERFDPARPLELRVVVDPQTQMVRSAYDMATGKKVYSMDDQMVVYLNPKVENGRLVSPAEPFLVTATLVSGTWKKRVPAKAKGQAAIQGVYTSDQKGFSGFSLFGEMYYTTRKFNFESPLRLLVVVDVQTMLPLEAYDMATRQKVFDAEELTAVYFDPEVREGRLVNPGAPYRRMGIIRTSVWEEARKRGVQTVALFGVKTFETGGPKTSRSMYGFSVAANVYRTNRPFDSKKTLRLLVLVDPENETPLQAFDAATGEKVYDTGEMIRVYLDPRVEGSRVVEPAKPNFSVRAIRDSAWEQIQSKADRVAFEGVTGYHQKNRVYFLMGGEQYRTSQPLKPGQNARLLVVADAATKKPTAAFNMDTGEQIFPVGSSPVEADPRLSGLADLALPDEPGAQAGSEESAVQWVESTHPLFSKGGYLPPEPVKEENVGEDGVTVPIIKQGMKPMKLALPDKYRQKGRRPIQALSADHVAAQIHLTADGRLIDRPVIKVVFEHGGKTAVEYFLARKKASGATEPEFISVVPGLTPLQYIALSKEWWLDQEKVRPIGEFTLSTSRSGYWLDLGRGSFPNGTRTALRIWLPKERFQGQDPFPVTLRTEWQEKAYLRPDGSRVGGYVTVVTVDQGTDKEQQFRYQFLGDNSGFAAMGTEELLDDVQNAGTALQGNPGDFLDYLLIYLGDERTEDEVKEMVRRFDELRLGQVAVGGGGGKGPGKILLEDYFEKASIFARKPIRDQETLIAVLLKVAFRELVKPESRQDLFRMLAEKIKQLQKEEKQAAGRPEAGEQVKELQKQINFFLLLQGKLHILTDEALLYRPAHIKTKLLPHQAVGAYFFKHHPRGYNGDFTGAGKSIETLAALDPGWKTFIAAPASLVDNWKKEIHKHIDPRFLKSEENPDGVVEVVILSGSRQRRERILEETKDKKNIIIIASIQGFQGKEALQWTVEKLASLNHGLDCVIIDESQFASNYRGEGSRTNAQQAEALQMITAPNIWWLSATGYGSDPSQLWSMLRALTRGTPETDQFVDFKKFRKKYPAKQGAGLRHLRGEMRPRSLNREAPEVMDYYDDPASGVPLEKQGARLPNLTQRSYKDIGGYELNEEQEKALLMMILDFPAFVEWFNQKMEERGEPERELNSENLNPFTMLNMILRLAVDPQYCGCDQESPVWGKLDEIVEQFVVQEKKRGILYTENTVILEKLLERYGRHGVVRIDGSVRGHVMDPDREGEVLMGYFDQTGELVIDPAHPNAEPVDAKTYMRHLFQNDPSIRLVAANMRAGGIGLDLTAGEFEVDVQLPRVYTMDRQMKGRFDRMDTKRPRYRIDRIRMVSLFKPGLAERWKGTVYEELAQELEKSGTPDEINVERLEMGKEVFKYVMTDLATDRDLDLFDPHSLWEAIPGIKDNPTVEQYYAKLPSKRLRETLEMFVPLYEKARGREKKQEIVQLAELYFRTGLVSQMGSLVALLAEEDEETIRLVSSLLHIQNKYARTMWLNHIIQLITKDLPENEVALRDLVEMFDFLEDQAPYLILPLYDTAKAYQNGPVLDILTGLLSEVQDVYREKKQHREILFQQMALWFLAARGPKMGEDFRGTLRKVLELYELLLLNKKIPLEERLAVTERLLRLVQFTPAADTLIQGGVPKDPAAAREVLEKAAAAAVQSEFQMSPEEARRFAEIFPGVLTVLQIQRFLAAKYPEQAAGLREGMRHVAAGDFGLWRNAQQGDRQSGQKINYLEKEPGFWEVFTREETVPLPGPMILGYESHQAQMAKSIGILEEMMAQEDSLLVAETEGKWVGAQFREWSQKSKGFRKTADSRRKALASALVKLRKEASFADLEPTEKKVLAAEGFGTPDKWEGLPNKVEERLHDYGHLQAWLDFKNALAKLLEEKPVPQQIADIKMLAARLSGRASNAGVTHVADQLDRFISLLERLKTRESYTGLTVQFTTDPAWMMERGMLHPRLVDCFNSFGNPDQVGALVDDLNSRNKILGLVWPEGVTPSWENRDKILARVVVKVKKQGPTADALPVLFPERPLAKGPYDFEDEILAALRISKMGELASYGAELWREGAPKDERQYLYDSGGYSDWEYFEPLFKILRRTNRSVPIFHKGVKAAGAEEKVRVYADGKMEGGGWKGVGEPIWQGTPVRKASFWNDDRLKGSTHLLLENVGTQSQEGYAVFRWRKQSYSIGRRFDLEKPLRLWIEVSYPEGEVLGAWDMATGVQVYSASIKVQVYGSGKITKGKLVGAGQPIWEGRLVLKSGFWDAKELARSSYVILENLPTYQKYEMAKFTWQNRAYPTGRLFDERHPLRLWVKVSYPEGTVLEAWDMATGERVYPVGNEIRIYAGGAIEGGKLLNAGDLLGQARTVHASSLQKDPRLKSFSHVMLEGVPTHSTQGQASFSWKKRHYFTRYRFDPENPLRLWLKVSYPELEVMGAWNMANGEQAYSLLDNVRVYGGGKISKGKLVGVGEPVWQGQKILKTIFWGEQRLKNISHITLENVPTRLAHGQAVFHWGQWPYAIGRPFDEKTPVRLWVKISYPDAEVMEAWDMATGERVYPVENEIRIYAGGHIEEGKLVGKGDLIWRGLAFRSTSIADAENRLKGISHLVAENVPVFPQKGLVKFSWGTRRYSTGRRFDPENPLRLWLQVSYPEREVTGAWDMATGDQVYPRPAESGDPRLGALANLAETGMEEALSGLFQEWAQVEGTDAVVVSSQLAGGPEGKLIRRALDRLPENLARRVYAAGNWPGLKNRWLKVIPSGAPEDVAYEVARQVPPPERVRVIGSLGRVFGVLLRDFSIEVEELAPGQGLEEFLAQLGLALGVPVAEIEDGLQRIRNTAVYELEA